MSPASKAADFAELKIVYLGLREMSDKKAHAFFALAGNIAATADAADALASAFDFTAKQLPKIIGGIYTTKGRASDDGARVQSLVPTFTYTGERIINNELIAAFEARDKAARVAQRARKLESEAKSDGMLARALRPLKVDYLKTDTIGRLALEVVILAELRRMAARG